MKNTILHIIAFVLFSNTSFAQTPLPAPPQTEAIVLIGGIAHLGNGELIENSIIGFDKGVITFVGDARSDQDLSGYKKIDITGKHIYPGFILPNSALGLDEIAAVQASVDKSEVGTMNPNIRSVIAYNTDSKIIATLRFNGVLIAETTPAGGRISGTSSVMNLDGWNWEDAALKMDIGIHMSWPNRMRWNFNEATWSYALEDNKNYSSDVEEITSFFDDAISYSRQSTKDRNMKLEAMRGLFSGEKILFISVDGSKEIIESVRFAQKMGVVKIVINSGTGIGALDVAPFLVENKIPVILNKIHSLPSNGDMNLNTPFKLPYLLSQAGVSVSLSHFDGAMSARNLPFYAGTAITYGVAKEEAVKMLTLNPAMALGIDKEVGSLERGKRATFFVSDGDALDMRTNNLVLAYIDGKKIELNNEQHDLYERYTKKYSEEKTEY